jgi:ribosomal protein L37AE/L43A
MPSMSEPVPPGPPPAPRLVVTTPKQPENDERMICERCGKAEMYRMHAVWRCPECGFKTDCCGW